jgi:hypothetical protein
VELKDHLKAETIRFEYLIDVSQILRTMIQKFDKNRTKKDPQMNPTGSTVREHNHLSFDYFIDRARCELVELEEALDKEDYGSALLEAADVANFMAHLYGVIRRREIVKNYPPRMVYKGVEIKTIVDTPITVAQPPQAAATRRVVAAACKYGDILFCGARHFDSVMRTQMKHFREEKELELIKRGEVKEGFIDQFGVFMDRQEAWNVAWEAGQINSTRMFTGCWGTLYSEDIH